MLELKSDENYVLNENDQVFLNNKPSLLVESFRILNSGHLNNATTLKKLFKYLVAKTTDDDFPTISSYQIAVEAFGKPEDFNSQLDCYPRVVAVRLRRKLSEFYQKNPPNYGRCVILCCRSYRLSFAPMAHCNDHATLKAATG